MFEVALGLTAENAEELRETLLLAAVTGDAVAAEADEYGKRYIVDMVVVGRMAPVTIRSAWIVRAGEDFPRLTTCFVR